MPRFNPDIIAALAEGRLDPEEAARLESEIASDPAAVADLAAQRTALEALSALTPLEMTELERAGLHASISEALGLAGAPTEAPVARRVPWGSLGIAAAALFGLVAIVPVVGLLNTGGDDATGTLAAVASTTTAVSAEAAELRNDDLGEAAAAAPEGDTFDSTQEAPGEDGAGFGSTTTAAARSTTSIEETTTTAVDESSTTTTAGPAPEHEQLIIDLTAIKDDPTAVEGLAEEALEENECWIEDTELRGPDPGDRWTFEYFDGERTVIVYFEFDSEGIAGPFMVYDTPACEELVEVP